MPIHKQVMVLTVGSGIWRDIGHPPDSFDGETLGKPCAYQNYFDSMNDHGTYVNGFLHWIGFFIGLGRGTHLVWHGPLMLKVSGSKSYHYHPVPMIREQFVLSSEY
ncbi:PREDICTED: F-box At3g07870 [Prunus dulcis]|uniref:PREDICTED: F-box At3g07870 n=1 Tax=Prunus dulcis TaxID=3755 RepID=A0A5E4G6S7_PRUDU|nr:PREDICTED: F-box At3g07870 [Prunus dulcis]